MKDPMRQVELARGQSRLVTWVEDDRFRLKKGLLVSLKGADPDHLWEIVWRGGTVQERSSLRQDWKVGGL